jgi:hypothetical protein
MTRIAPLPREAIADPELQALIAEGEALGVPDDLFPRIIARRAGPSGAIAARPADEPRAGQCRSQAKGDYTHTFSPFCERQVFR